MTPPGGGDAIAVVATGGDANDGAVETVDDGSMAAVIRGDGAAAAATGADAADGAATAIGDENGDAAEPDDDGSIAAIMGGDGAAAAVTGANADDGAATTIGEDANDGAGEGAAIVRGLRNSGDATAAAAPCVAGRPNDPGAEDPGAAPPPAAEKCRLTAPPPPAPCHAAGVCDAAPLGGAAAPTDSTDKGGGRSIDELRY